MNLAIFMDARAVSGDASLLDSARDHALKLVIGSNTYLARMANAIDQFQRPATSWWGRLTQLQVREPETFDLKKIGTFPIVHGARVLALEHRLQSLSTVERLQTMADQLDAWHRLWCAT
jgi:CBS domain-containing protein